MSKLVLKRGVSTYITNREEIIGHILDDVTHSVINPIFEFVEKHLQETSDADLVDLFKKCASEGGWDFESISDEVEEDEDQGNLGVEVVLETEVPKKKKVYKKKSRGYL
jgi:hypothetical protein